MGAQAIVRLGPPRQQAEPVAGRIAALARAHALIDDKLTDLSEIGLHELIEAQIEPYATEGDRFAINVPATSLSRTIAIPLGLIVNELATNALKYGALSAPEGQVTIGWTLADEALVLSWRA